MIEMPEETGDAKSNPITSQLIKIINKLSIGQQEYLLEMVQDWIKDKRNFPRKDCIADIVYSDNTRLAQGMIVNISAGGLYLQPDSPFTIGQNIILSFEHPFSNQQMKVNGKIVRSDEKGIGVKFDQIIGDIL